MVQLSLAQAGASHDRSETSLCNDVLRRSVRTAESGGPVMRGEIGEVSRLCQRRHAKNDFSCQCGPKATRTAGTAFEFCRCVMGRHTRRCVNMRHPVRACAFGRSHRNLVMVGWVGTVQMLRLRMRGGDRRSSNVQALVAGRADEHGCSRKPLQVHCDEQQARHQKSAD